MLRSMTSPNPIARARPVWMCAVAALLGVLPVTTGCQRTLVRDQEALTQYDRYDTVRDQRSPPYLVDEFGARRPNLRGRLLEK